MDTRRQNLIVVVANARDQAKQLLALLESQRHPQTNRSSSLYLALVSMQKRLKAMDSAPAVAQLVPDLEQLVTLCEGKLAPIKSLLEDALHIAQSVRG